MQSHPPRDDAASFLPGSTTTPNTTSQPSSSGLTSDTDPDHRYQKDSESASAFSYSPEGPKSQLWLKHLPPGPKETPTQSIRKKQKSVKSLTREYELGAPNTTYLSTESCAVDSTTAQSRDPFRRTLSRTNSQDLSALDTSKKDSASSSSPIDSKVALATPSSSSLPTHSRRPSTLLLASPSYPSSLGGSDSTERNAEQRPDLRSRRSSGSLSSDSSGVRLASAAYPSTYAAAPRIPTSTGVLGLREVNRPLLGASSSATEGKSMDQQMHPSLASADALNVNQYSQAANIGRSQSKVERGTQHGYKLRDAEEEENDAVADLYRAQSTSARKPLSSMTPAERREHSRRHSRVHSRNLSVFFPQPGTQAEAEHDINKVQTAFGRPPITVDTSSSKDPDSPGVERASSATYSELSPSPTKSRRGHHSKHSVSYDMFSAEPRGSSGPMRRDFSASSYYSATSEGPGSEEHSRAGRMQPQAEHLSYRSVSGDHSSRLDSAPQDGQRVSSQLASADSRLRQPLPASFRLVLAFGVGHFFLGSALWISGQTVDLLSVTGLGYLVVFDAMGVLNECLSQWLAASKSVSSVRDRHRAAHFYSARRISTLLNFVQTIYLLFAAVYVCKESIEHVLLEQSVDPAAAPDFSLPIGSPEVEPNMATGTAGGHHHTASSLEPDLTTNLPTALLILSTAACLSANLFLANHAKLVAASGINTTANPNQTSRRHSRSQSVLVSTTKVTGPLLSLLSNPFSLTVAFFSGTLLFSALAMSAVQVTALDKVLAGLESVAMWYVALPASKVLGKVLLQTAPTSSSKDEGGRTQVVQLLRATKALEEEPLITQIKAPHVWQLTPSTAPMASDAKGHSLALSGLTVPNSSFATQSRSTKAKCPSLVATLEIILSESATDADVLRLTRWAYERLAPSVGAGMGVDAGETLRGSLTAGELVVDVRREGKQSSTLASSECPHHGHDHDHGKESGYAQNGGHHHDHHHCGTKAHDDKQSHLDHRDAHHHQHGACSSHNEQVSEVSRSGEGMPSGTLRSSEQKHPDDHNRSHDHHHHHHHHQSYDHHHHHHHHHH